MGKAELVGHLYLIQDQRPGLSCLEAHPYPFEPLKEPSATRNGCCCHCSVIHEFSYEGLQSTRSRRRGLYLSAQMIWLSCSRPMRRVAQRLWRQWLCSSIAVAIPMLIILRRIYLKLLSYSRTRFWIISGTFFLVKAVLMSMEWIHRPLLGQARVLQGLLCSPLLPISAQTPILCTSGIQVLLGLPPLYWGVYVPILQEEIC